MAEASAATRHIRGSSLLLVGRIVSLGINFGVQILTVRYLAKADYGAFAYALSVVGLAASATVIGLDKATARFVPIYHEERQFGRMFGTIAVIVGVVALVGVVFVGATFAFRTTLAEHIVNDPVALDLLLIVVAVGPMTALEAVFQNLLAVFAGARAIFFRRHVVGPAIKLVAVLSVVLTGGGVHELAVAYLIGGLVGIAIYLAMMVQILRRVVPAQFDWSSIELPFGPVLRFSIPLVTTSAFFIFEEFVVLIVLENMHGTLEVADIRAVAPVAGLNFIVLQSFEYLYTPVAARLYAQQNGQAIGDLYWGSALWIAVASFPIFALTTCLAEPITLLLFGERYAGAGSLLAILSIGMYLFSAFGFNFQTLRIYHRVPHIVACDLASLAAGMILCFLLIPSYHAMGAAVAASAMLIIHKVLNHLAMGFTTEVPMFRWSFAPIYLLLLGSAAGIWAMNQFLAPPVEISVGVVALTSLGILFASRNALDIAETFPELLRLPGLRHILTR